MPGAIVVWHPIDHIHEAATTAPHMSGDTVDDCQHCWHSMHNVISLALKFMLEHGSATVRCCMCGSLTDVPFRGIEEVMSKSKLAHKEEDK